MRNSETGNRDSRGKSGEGAGDAPQLFKLKNLSQSSVRGLAALAGFAFGENRLVKSYPQALGKLVQFIVAVNLDGLLGGVEDYLAFVTPMHMFVEFFAQSGIGAAPPLICQL